MKQDEEKQDENEGRRTSRPHPKHTLEEALIIAQTIRDTNAGRPMKRLLLADAMGRKPTSSEFKVLLSSSLKYGLTTGSEKAEYVELTPLGVKVTRPLSPSDKVEALQRAAMNPDLFKNIYQHYKDAKVPTDQYFKNALESEFGVAREWVDEAAMNVLENGRFAGLIREISGSPYVVIGEPTQAAQEMTTPQVMEPRGLEPTVGPVAPTLVAYPPPKPKVFLSHSKNTKIVGQLREMLKFGGFDFELAVERETTAIPIPQKIFDLMRNCNCAVINVSADEQEKRNGDKYAVNQNVLIEIGGAFLLYNKRVILLVDKRIELPSNLQGLATLRYEGDELSWDIGMRLQKALTEFREDIDKRGAPGTS